MKVKSMKWPGVKVEISSITTVVDDGYHNAFTDMTFWNGHHYIAYRAAQTHGVKPHGDVVVLRNDSLGWGVVKIFDTGGDDRDPKFFQREGMLGLVWGTYHDRWGDNSKTIRGSLYDVISHCAHSRDGKCWSPPVQMYRPDYWVWSVVPTDDDGFMCAAYHHGDPGDVMSIHVLESMTLTWWQKYATVLESHELRDVSEPVLFRWGENWHCLIRGADDDGTALLATEGDDGWEVRDLNTVIQAAARIEFHGGQIIIGRTEVSSLKRKWVEGRNKHVRLMADKDYETAVWWLSSPGSELERIAVLPSGGDNGYAGLAWDGDDLLVSYYSQHEYPASRTGWPRSANIYLARLRLEDNRDLG